MTPDALPQFLAHVGLDVIPVRQVGLSLHGPDGPLRPARAIEQAGYRLFYVGPGPCPPSWPSSVPPTVDAGATDQGAGSPFAGALLGSLSADEEVPT